MQSISTSSGSLYASLQFLPRWYQALGIGGIAILVYLRQNPIVGWLVSNLHISFGTEYLWYNAYQKHLENMTFNERLGFTFYGVALIGLAFFIFRYCIYSSHVFARGELFPDKAAQNVFCIFLFCIVETLRLREIIYYCFQDPQSSSSIALGEMQAASALGNSTDGGTAGPNATLSGSTPSYHAFFSLQNPHFIIQRSIFIAVVKTLLFHHFPVFLISGLYRLVKDVPRKMYVSLRWYMVTCTTTFVFFKLCGAMRDGVWGDLTLWMALLCWFIYVSVVNFCYGTSKRAGMTKDTSYLRCAKMAAWGLMVCMLMWVVSLITMLALSVSVHVFELLFMWAGIFLTVVWVPATVDSFATSQIVVLTGVTAFIGYGMGALTWLGVSRYMLYVSLSWIDVCLLYNFFLNAFCSRWVSMCSVVATIALVAWCTVLDSNYMQWDVQQLKATAEALHQPFIERYVLAILNWVTELCNLQSTFRVPDALPVRVAQYLRISQNPALCAYVGLVSVNFLCGLFILLLLQVLHSLTDSPVRRRRLQRKSIFTITPVIFFTQIIRGITTLIVALIFLSTYVLVIYALLPRSTLMKALPQMVKHFLAFVVSCSILGFLDCAEVITELILRAVGLREPPVEEVEVTHPLSADHTKKNE